MSVEFGFWDVWWAQPIALPSSRHYLAVVKRDDPSYTRLAAGLRCAMEGVAHLSEMPENVCCVNGHGQRTVLKLVWENAAGEEDGHA